MFGAPPDPTHPPAAHTGKRRHLTCDLAAQHGRCNTQHKHAALNLAYHLISGIWARGIAAIIGPFEFVKIYLPITFIRKHSIKI